MNGPQRPAQLVLVLGIALGIVAEWSVLHHGPLEATDAGGQALAAADFVAGGALIVCGVVCRRRRPESWIGCLLVVAGFAWFLGTLSGSSFDRVASFGGVFVTLHRGPLFHALLSYPTGRLRRALERLVVAVGYAWAAIAAAGESPELTIIVSCLFSAAAVGSYVRASVPQRRARVAGLAGALALAAVLITGSVADLAGAGGATNDAVLWVYDGIVLAIALGLLVGLLRGRWTRATVTGLVVDLGKLPAEGILRERLARALGDPSLAVGYWMGEEQDFFDETGRRLVRGAPGSGRELTIVRDGDEPVAALVHDVGILENRELVGSVAAVARIAVSSVRLQKEIRRQVEQVEASRRRILESADLQRRRLERELREGAEHRLVQVKRLLADVQSESTDRALLSEALFELEHARTELRELGQGILPELLTAGGLAPALLELAQRATVPVDVRSPSARFPSAVEVAVYFVCSEALANIGKHARATAAAIDVTHVAERLVVVVSDDGVGGATPGVGSGLRGLADRVEALGGTFTADSPSAGGTRLRAELPLT